MAGDFGRDLKTSAWSICVLRDGTVFSGDSQGCVHVWDGEVGVLLQTLHQHTADVLSIVGDPDEQQVFASGLDSKVACFHRTGQNSDPSIDQSSHRSPYDYTWVYTTAHRPHSHDVHSLCILPSPTSEPLLISGGLDCKLCTYSITDFAATRPRWELPTPASGLVSSSEDFSTVAIRHQNSLDIWSVDSLSKVEGEQALATTEAVPPAKKSKNKRGTQAASEVVVAPTTTCPLSTAAPPSPPNYRLSIRLALKDSDHIHVHLVSPDGRLIILSRADSGTRMWALTPHTTDGARTLSKVDLPDVLPKTLCTHMEFTADSRRLIVATCSGHIILLDVEASSSSSGGVKISILSQINHLRAVRNYNSSSDGSGSSSSGSQGVDDDSDPLTSLCGSISVAVDGRYLAVSDCSHTVYVYNLDRLVYTLIYFDYCSYGAYVYIIHV